MNSEELYREIILDHARHPRNFQELPDATVRIEAENPLCGDELTLFLQTTGTGQEATVNRATFTGQACAICTASASLLTQKIRQKTLREVTDFSRKFQELLRRPACEPVGDCCRVLGDLALLEGVRKFPMRVKCATLPWHALDAAVNELCSGHHCQPSMHYVAES